MTISEQLALADQGGPAHMFPTRHNAFCILKSVRTHQELCTKAGFRTHGPAVQAPLDPCFLLASSLFEGQNHSKVSKCKMLAMCKVFVEYQLLTFVDVLRYSNSVYLILQFLTWPILRLCRDGGYTMFAVPCAESKV